VFLKKILHVSHKLLEYGIAAVVDIMYVSGLDSDDEESKHSVSAELKTKLDQQYYKSLDGFLIVIAKNGDIIYVSENIEKHLGLTQVCLRLMHEVFKCVLTVHCCIVISNDEQTSRDVPDRDVHYPTETG